MRDVRRALALLMMLPLGGCIESTFDISQQLTPAQPIKAGTYTDDTGKAYSVVRDGLRYKVTAAQDTMAMALFAAPENPKFYVLQLLGTDADSKVYEYAFAARGSDPDSFVVYDLQKPDAWLMPDDLRKLAPYRSTGFAVIDEAADTLHVLREIVRLGIPLDPQVKKTVYHVSPP